MNLEKFISDNSVEIIDILYSSLDERSRSIIFPSEKLNYFIENGIGVDGSSLGIKSEEKSDMVVKPEIDRYYTDPFSEFSSLILFGELHSTYENEEFDGDPRRILKKTVSLLNEKGIANEVEILPELEFYIFNECYFESSKLYRTVDIRVQNVASPYNGYHADYPFDLNKDFRMNLLGTSKTVGIELKYAHHEVGKFGQHEIEIARSDPIRAVEHIFLCKYIVRKLATSFNLVATFMPKPIYGEPGNGMHFHILLKLDGKSIFYDEKDKENVSKSLRLFSNGILKHSKAISAFTNSTTNSYKRLNSGFEAPHELSYKVGCRESAIRIADYCKDEDIDIEYRVPDATCNPYLAISAIILAGLDGLINIDDDIKRFGKLPSSLLESINALEKDKEFLLKYDVFPEWFINKWIKNKKEEFFEVENNPSSIEFSRYFYL
jgi:glutamine synthetase